jgi:hypothetical protein
MRTIWNFLTKLFGRKKSEAQEIKELIFNVLQAKALCAARPVLGDANLYAILSSTKNLDELMFIFKTHFVVFCQFKIVSVSLIEEFKNVFKLYGIYANESCRDGYLVVDHNNIATASGKSLAVGIHHALVKGQHQSIVHGFDTSCISLEQEAQGSVHQYSKMYLYNASRGVSFDHTEVYAHDHSFISANGRSKVVALRQSTYELNGQATVATALRS